MVIKTIARTLGLSRNTVRKYLHGEAEPPRYLVQAPRPVNPDPFKAYLQERIEAVQSHWIPATGCCARSRLKAMQAASAS